MKRDHLSTLFADVNKAACEALPDLVRKWFPKGRPQGNEWWVGNLAGEPGQSLRIVLSGPKCGIWKDFATNEGGGDPVSLAAAVMGINQVEAAKKLGALLGVTGARVQHSLLSRAQSCEAAGKAASSDQENKDEVTRIEKAVTLASQCIPVAGTPAAIYLGGRSIDPGKLPVGEVRWHPSSSAILYCSRNVAGELTAVQRVFLHQDGKARSGPNGKKTKWTNGVLKGSACTLPGAGEDILICDGPEDALSLWQVTGASVRCAFGMNWGDVPLPKDASVILVADNDDRNSAASDAVAKAACRLLERGFRVKLTYPPNEVKDTNDLLRKHGPEAVRRMVAAAKPVPVAGPEGGGASSALRGEVLRLSRLSPLDYELERDATAARLSLAGPTLDRLVKAARSGVSPAEKNDPCPVVDPWPSAVHLGELLDDIRDAMRRFIVCDEGSLAATALWTAFTWLIDRVRVAPLLVITAPEKQCGKSVLLSLVGKLAYRPVSTSNISPAAVYRVVEDWAPTLLIDEADTFLGKSEDMRGIINSGHTREAAYVIRLEGDNHQPRKFSTWGAKAIAGIGHLADTLMDRAIVVELRRKRPGEETEKLGFGDQSDFSPLAQKLARFAQDAGDIIGALRPEFPAGLSDRAQDNWESLLAIAEHAGGHWPETARTAALRLSGGVRQALSVSAELLSDIRDVFERQGLEKITTADLLEELNADELAPWATYSRGRALTPRGLAKLLDGYGIKPRNIWVRDKCCKGYDREAFEGAFASYLSAETSKAAEVPPALTSMSSDAPMPHSYYAPFTPPSVTPIPPPPMRRSM